MPIQSKLADDRMTAFMEACRKKSVKLTHQRIEIYREVAFTQEHPDVKTIYQKVKKEFQLLRWIQYRNLKFLSDQGLITIMGLSQEHLRVDANLEPHHHFVCVKCGAIRDFSSDSLSDMVIPKEARHLGHTISVQIEIKGVCEHCQNKS